MLIRNFILFYIFIFFVGAQAFAQSKPGSMKDSAVYKKIEDYSSRRKFTSIVYNLILKPVAVQSAPADVFSGDKVYVPFVSYEGKIIRSIHIVTLDPFGFSVYDTTSGPHSFIEKSGNYLHVKTQHFAIRNQMLIHENDRFDSLLVKESERLIRSQSYIRDVAVTAVQAGGNADSVDVFLRVSDLWTIIPDGSLSNEKITFIVTEKNLGGLGHTFSDSYTQNYLNGDHAYSTFYFIPNIENSYISSRLGYAMDENRNFRKSLNIERPFFSPLTQWAGGVFVSQEKQPGWIYKNDTTRLFLTSKYNIQDYWGATAWQVFKGRSEFDRTTKLILSGRIYTLKYLEKPVEQPGMLEYYTNERFFMSGLGISSRKYLKQYYIFRFGTPEDVPVGLTYGIVGGYQLKNSGRWYWGVQHSWGNFFRLGYFGTQFEYGTFINASHTAEGMFSAKLNYFSGLITIGNWKFRQFARPELIIGMNRTAYDRLTLNDGYGLSGFNSGVLSGTRRFLFVIQTQSYAPWNLFGFRFGPYMNLSFGMLGNQDSGFRKSRMYPQIGMGVLIRNDYLVIKYFQLSFAFYPSIPGNGNNVFKANPFRSTDFGFPDFVIGKPAMLEFR